MTTLGFFNYNDTYINITQSNNIMIGSDNCLTKYPTKDKDIYWEGISKSNGFPKWLECAFYFTATIHKPDITDTLIYDFSVSSPRFDYASYLKNNTFLGSKDINLGGEPLK